MCFLILINLGKNISNPLGIFTPPPPPPIFRYDGAGGKLDGKFELKMSLRSNGNFRSILALGGKTLKTYSFDKKK